MSEEEGSIPAMPSCGVVKEDRAVPPMPLGAFVKEQQMVPLKGPAQVIK